MIMINSKDKEMLAENIHSARWINTASASKVGKIRPFWGEVKKLKVR